MSVTTSAGRWGSGTRTRVLTVLLTVLTLCAALLVPGTVARADNNPTNARVRDAQTWFAYVETGESITATFTKIGEVAGASGQWDPIITVTRPDGTVASTCEILSGTPTGKSCDFDAVADLDGVWSVSITSPTGAKFSGRQIMSWDIDVTSSGTPVDGRVWTEKYIQNDNPISGGPVDLSMWYLTEQGYIYQVERLAMNGIDSQYAANAFGVVDPATCASAHSSTVGRGFQSIVNTECAYTPYKIFFSTPAADLPATVTLPDGTSTWLKTPPVEPTLDEVTFTQDGLGSRSGTVTAHFGHFEGNATVRVDVDGDGVFDGPADRTLGMAVVAGEGSIAFDGLDAAGTAIPVTSPIGFEVRADGFAEVHFTDADVEYLADGITVTRLNGPEDGTKSRIFWDDTFVTDPAKDPQALLKCSTTPDLTSGPDGVDSTTGVHAWGLGDCLWAGTPMANAAAGDKVNGGSWGNNRYIDNWATIDVELRKQIVLPGAAPELRMAKSSDPSSGSVVMSGQVVTYTLTYTNSGDAPDVVDSTDDMSALLDDADVTSEPVSDTEGISAVRDGDRIRITGTLAGGSTAHVTYQVTVRPDDQRGDGLLDNVLLPDDPDGCVGSVCDTEHTVVGLTMSKSSDPASGTTVRAGQVVTYTLRFTSTGTVPVVVDAEDALAGVLDDADITSKPVASDPALTVGEIVDGRFPISGILEPGQEVTVTYRATVKEQSARGDGILANFLVEPSGDPVCNTAKTNCTTHPTEPVVEPNPVDPTPVTPAPAGGLAMTGPQVLGVTLGALALTAAGAVLLVARRRAS